MKKFFLFVFFCCFGHFITASAGNIEPVHITAPAPLKKVVREIAKSNVFEYPSTTTTAQKVASKDDLFQQLQQVAGSEDLLKLAAKHKNAVVRLYAYRAIVQQFKEIPKNILDQFNNDDAVVNTLREGVAGKTTVKKIADSFLY